MEGTRLLESSSFWVPSAQKCGTEVDDLSTSSPREEKRQKHKREVDDPLAPSPREERQGRELSSPGSCRTQRAEGIGKIKKNIQNLSPC